MGLGSDSVKKCFGLKSQVNMKRKNKIYREISKKLVNSPFKGYKYVNIC